MIYSKAINVNLSSVWRSWQSHLFGAWTPTRRGAFSVTTGLDIHVRYLVLGSEVACHKLFRFIERMTVWTIGIRTTERGIISPREVDHCSAIFVWVHFPVGFPHVDHLALKQRQRIMSNGLIIYLWKTFLKFDERKSIVDKYELIWRCLFLSFYLLFKLSYTNRVTLASGIGF